MKKYFVEIESAFNNGKDARVEECQGWADAKRRVNYYSNDPNTVSVKMIIRKDVI